MFTEGESRIDWGREFQALAAITGKLRSAMARYDLVTGATNVILEVILEVQCRMHDFLQFENNSTELFCTQNAAVIHYSFAPIF